MKKWLLLIGAFWIGMSVFAAYQYQQKPGIDGAPGSGTFVFQDNMSLHIYVKDATDLGGYGFFNLSDGNLVEAQVSSDGKLEAKLGDFKAGDTIGIWVKTNDGKVYTSTGDWNPDNGGSTNGMRYNEKTGYYELSWHSAGGGPNFEFMFDTAADVPSGQPLPGAVVALLLGGGALGILGLRRRRSRIARSR